ncbi:Ff.00g050970.m01.CDS01 [Fusarium sp. VM40]|nr:Ff.00g050970.m01.CDS01 [Fusarium sp. VM40]
MTSNLGPTTATVVDFICLFTHDLKRKQKRWQDGVLKYHTFNKRVMVYDDRSHFIGDAHWQGGGDLEPGDEFELDRGSAIVQVSDCTGQREQDLTELLDKRAKEVEKRRTNAGTRTPGSTAVVTQTPRNDQNAPHFQLRHRPLNDLVGGSSRIGRAVVSPHSPYEVRKMTESTGQQQDSPSEEARPSKRRRREDSPPSKMGHARALFGTTLTLTPFSSSMPLARSQTLQEKSSTESKVLSSSTKDDPSNELQHVNRSSRSPPLVSKSKETDTNVTSQSVPRRVLTQRASLKELLAGNEHNRTGEPLGPREALISQEPKPQKRHVDPVPKTSRNAQRSREAEAGRPNSLHMPAREVAKTGRSNRGKEQPADSNEVAFLNWLVESEGTASAHRTPVSPSSKRLGHSKRSGNDTTSTHKRPVPEIVQKVIHDPIVINEDEEESSARVQPQTAASESSKIKLANRSEPHGMKRTLAADRASTMEADVDKPPPAKEPRTKLRIRSRQRRGLLMIAQNKQGSRTGSTARSLPSSSGVDSDVLTTQLPIVDSVSTLGESELAQENAVEKDAVEKDAVEKNAAEMDISEKEPKQQTSIISSDSSIPTRKPATQSAKDLESNQTEATSRKNTARDTYKDATKGPNTGREDDEPLHQSDDEVGPNSDKIPVNNLPGHEASVMPPRRRANPSRRSRQKAIQAILSDDDEIGADNSLSKPDNEKEDSSAESEPDRKSEPKPSSGPRITKMSRKSVKSREILGFVMPPEDFPTAGFNVGHNDPTAAKKPIDNSSTIERPLEGVENASNDLGHTQPMAHEPEAVQLPINENKSQTKQPARIVNPATRGRKAARKQDAAGLPPQPLVQLAPTTDSRAVLATPFKATTPAATMPQSELPGFCKANGGAWSRHAEDLLGMTRPSKGPSRQ